MTVDLSVFTQGPSGRFKTKADFDRESEAFEIERLAKLKASQSNDPAAVKVANEIQKARASGDMQRVRDLTLTSKIFDKGVVYDAEGNPMAMGGYGEAVGSIAGTKKAYEADAQNQSDLYYDPQTAGAEAGARLEQQSIYEPQIREDIAQREAGVSLKTDPLIEARKKQVADAQDFLGRYPTIEEKSRQAVDAIKGMRDPDGTLTKDISAVVGQKNYFRGAIPFTEKAIPGTPAASGFAKIKQAKGQVFLDAYEALRGGGAITNIEGEKGEQAKARMDNAQSEADFAAALNDLQEIIERGQIRSQEKYQTSLQAVGQANPANIPMKAVQFLRANPDTAAQFDQKYGPGASSMVLGQ